VEGGAGCPSPRTPLPLSAFQVPPVFASQVSDPVGLEDVGKIDSIMYCSPPTLMEDGTRR